MNAKLATEINKLNPKTYWKRGVKEYARDFIESAEVELTPENARAALLNGAKDWSQYSDGGCALVYDADIAERLCTPSELKRKKGGDLQPNSRETWLDIQARALHQAFNLIKRQLN